MDWNSKCMFSTGQCWVLHLAPLESTPGRMTDHFRSLPGHIASMYFDCLVQTKSSWLWLWTTTHAHFLLLPPLSKWRASLFSLFRLCTRFIRQTKYDFKVIINMIRFELFVSLFVYTAFSTFVSFQIRTKSLILWFSLPFVFGNRFSSSLSSYSSLFSSFNHHSIIVLSSMNIDR